MSETLTQLAAQFRRRLAAALPGARAMRSWTPQLAYGRHFSPPPYDARRAAVAVLLYPAPDGDGWRTPLTLRPAHLTDHAGQVSLPGGALHEGEEPAACAWRELEEELGVSPDALLPVGALTPIYIFNSNFFVTPCVALASARPAFRPSAAEVAAVLETSPQAWSEAAPRETLWVERRGLRFRAPALAVQGRNVWGASALILSELGALWRELAPA